MSKSKVFVINKVNWEYNDEYLYESGLEKPAKVCLTRKSAHAARDELNHTAFLKLSKNKGEWDFNIISHLEWRGEKEDHEILEALGEQADLFTVDMYNGVFYCSDPAAITIKTSKRFIKTFDMQFYIVNSADME